MGKHVHKPQATSYIHVLEQAKASYHHHIMYESTDHFVTLGGALHFMALSLQFG